MALATKRWVWDTIGRGDPQHPRRLQPISGATFPWDKLGFGYGLNPDGDNAAEIVIYAGELHHGARAIIEVAETKKVITVDQQYIWVEYVLGSGAAAIAGPSTTRPVSTAADSTFRKWLFTFTLSGGTASRDKIGNMGNIVLLGNFA